ncbi:MAG TPA: multidrug efflux RND transporter permease subunit [Bryobacteraceae bacterium]|nr:multidrug efflux RND transporter permease subunit [Bryobacteraceae bacterium]
MNISAPFIQKPVATTLLTIALALAGALAFNFLPVAPLPQVEYPTIRAGARMPGASPETMAATVATPLERQFGRIAGVTEMTSNSQTGSTNITLQFDLSRNIDSAARDVQAAINAARGQLPTDLRSNPYYYKVNPADSPILILGLTSETIDKPHLYDAAESVLSQKMLQIEGIGEVNIGGGARPAVRVEVNPMALNGYGLSLEDVRTTLQNANAISPVGELSNSKEAWMIKSSDQLELASQYQPLIVSYHNGSAVRLRDVANVYDWIEDRRHIGLENGKDAVLLILFRQPGANIIDTVDRVKALLPQLRNSISPAIHLDVAMDRTVTIRASVEDVEFTLVISIILVILVVFFFLRNVWATAIPSVAVPLSLLGTFAIMYLLGYSLDNLSLMALTISTGFVVDDAIVVIENISRYLEKGMRPMEAALRGSREIGFTVVSMSASLIAVFIPILLMGGIVGRLFREFAVTLAVAIAVSLVVSLTTTPMLCARFLKPHSKGKHNIFYRASEKFFDSLLAFYRVSLRVVLRHPQLTLVILLATIAINVMLYIAIPKGFFPEQDTGRLNGAIVASQDMSFQAMGLKLRQFVNIIKEDPAVQTVAGFAGGGTANIAGMFIALKPLDERKVSAQKVVERLRGKISAVPGARLYIHASQDIHVGGRSSNSEYEYTIQSDSIPDLNKWAPALLAKLRTLPQLRDANSDQQIHGLESALVIDRDTASRLGVPLTAIDNTLYDAFGQRQVSTMYEALNQYHVVMEVAPEYQQSPAALRSIYVRSTNGTMVPLSTFAHYGLGNTSLSVNHQGQFPSITMSFALAPGVALSDAVDVINKAERDIGMPLSIRGGFTGTAKAFEKSLKSEPWLILAALVTVYIVLGMLYESYIHPITILSTLPSAGVGAIIALLLFNVELSVIALIGIILLIGIVKKNAILMIDFALEVERKEGLPAQEAIYEACLLRFRPILMTTMAALLGGLPLALGTGTGSELRRPLGITIVGGLILSQVLTLYTTPVVYLYLDRFRARFWKSRRRVLAAPDFDPSIGVPQT